MLLVDFPGSSAVVLLRGVIKYEYTHVLVVTIPLEHEHTHIFTFSNPFNICLFNFSPRSPIRRRRLPLMPVSGHPLQPPWFELLWDLPWIWHHEGTLCWAETLKDWLCALQDVHLLVEGDDRGHGGLLMPASSSWPKLKQQHKGSSVWPVWEECSPRYYSPKWPHHPNNTPNLWEYKITKAVCFDSG